MLLAGETIVHFDCKERVIITAPYMPSQKNPLMRNDAQTCRSFHKRHTTNKVRGWFLRNNRQKHFCQCNPFQKTKSARQSPIFLSTWRFWSQSKDHSTTHTCPATHAHGVPTYNLRYAKNSDTLTQHASRLSCAHTRMWVLEMLSHKAARYTCVILSHTSCIRRYVSYTRPWVSVLARSSHSAAWIT